MRLIRLEHQDGEVLFGIDAIDREELVKLLRHKLEAEADPTYVSILPAGSMHPLRVKRLQAMLDALTGKGP